GRRDDRRGLTRCVVQAQLGGRCRLSGKTGLVGPFARFGCSLRFEVVEGQEGSSFGRRLGQWHGGCRSGWGNKKAAQSPVRLGRRERVRVSQLTGMVHYAHLKGRYNPLSHSSK